MINCARRPIFILTNNTWPYLLWRPNRFLLVSLCQQLSAFESTHFQFLLSKNCGFDYKDFVVKDCTCLLIFNFYYRHYYSLCYLTVICNPQCKEIVKLSYHKAFNKKLYLMGFNNFTCRFVFLAFDIVVISLGFLLSQPLFVLDLLLFILAADKLCLTQ